MRSLYADRFVIPPLVELFLYSLAMGSYPPLVSSERVFCLFGKRAETSSHPISVKSEGVASPDYVLFIWRLGFKPSAQQHEPNRLR